MNDAGDSQTLTDENATAAQGRLAALRDQLGSVVLGQGDAVDAVVVGLLADGHVLLEGVPGVAKTLLARALAASLGLGFKRVQFTPDLMPSDLLGTRVWDQEHRAWELSRGPIFTDVLLADEVNRTPPKTQAALLEAMEERQVTLDGERHDLGDAFFVIATENPLEFEGTYPLPEAQTDRFLLKVTMGYPDAEAEMALLSGGAQRVQDRVADLRAVISREELIELRDVRARVRVDDAVRAYVLALLRATREAPALKLGASPRAGLFLLAVAQAAAITQGRAYAIPDDVKTTARGVLRHRLALSTEAELDGLDADAVLDGLLERVPMREE
jgi:MoxR-like ATPase